MNPFLTVNDIKEFEIDLTGTCNLNCPLCTRNYKHAQHMLGSNHRSLQEITSQLDMFPNLERIMLAGAISEPTTYKHFFGLLDYLNSRNIFIDLFSNADTNVNWERIGRVLAEGNPENLCTFTICGSTQETHAKYRKGSSLLNILKNSRKFRRGNKIGQDTVQIIEFEYNKDDNFHGIKSLFSNSFTIHSEGDRRLKDFVVQPEELVRPVQKIDKAITSIFKHRPIPGKDKVNIECKSMISKKLFMNQYGQLHHCYISAEFPESKDDFLLKDPSTLTKDTIFDFTNVLKFKYPDCFQCSTRTKKIIEKSGLDFIC